MLWTYPPDGATDVPTNAALWFVTNMGSGTARLDGTPLRVGEHGEFLWGDLQANRDYVLTSKFQNDVELVVRFRTGSSRAQPPGELVIDGYTAGGSGFGANADNCLDTPPYTRLELHPEERIGILGYLVNGVVYPATHGDPARHVQGESVEGGCTDLAPIGVGGLVGPTSRYCVPTTSDDGCNATRGSRGGWLALLALAVFAGRRRAC